MYFQTCIIIDVEQTNGGTLVSMKELNVFSVFKRKNLDIIQWRLKIEIKNGLALLFVLNQLCEESLFCSARAACHKLGFSIIIFCFYTK